MNTEKEAILIVNEVLGYVHSKFIREGSAFSQEYVDFRQRHNDRITDIVKQRLETRPNETIVSGWIEIEGNKKLFEKHIYDDTMLRFDNGDECRYADDWPFAVATHFQIKESQ